MKALFYYLKSRIIAPLVLLSGALLAQAQAPYCTITYSSGWASWGFTQVTIGTYNQTPSFSSSYGNFLSQNVPLTAGTPTSVSINSLGWVSVGLAIDFNNDNDFEDAGEVLALPGYIAASPQLYTFTITVPPNVVSGNYRMRIWTRTANGGGANNGEVPCGAYGYGRYADYTAVISNSATCLPPSNLNVTPTSNTAAISWTASTSSPANYRWKIVASGADPNTAPAVATTATGTTATTSANATGLTPATAYDAYAKALCSAADSSVWTMAAAFTTLCDGTPATGTASASVTTVCPTVNFDLMLNGVTPAPGLTYQWQSSPTVTGTFSNIPGGTTPTFTTSQSALTYYRCVVTCTGSAQSSTSNVISVGINAPTSCYCSPTSTTGTSYYITSFSTTGGLTNITNNSTGSGSFNNYTATHSASALMGATVNFSLTTTSALVTRGIYIDWNQDGAFDEVNERVYTGNYSAVNATTVSGSFMVPFTALPGTTRMRVRTAYYSGNTMHACNNLTNGEAEDYTFVVVSPVGVCVNPVNLAVSGITQTNANITFTAPPVGNTPTNYIYELREPGTTAGSGATGLVLSNNTTGTTVNLTNLDPATNYVFHIRTFCSVGDSSIWVQIPFTTTTDTLTPVALTQFNADVVANGVGSAISSTTNDVDGVNYALVAPDFQATTSSATPTYAVPANRVVQNGFRKYRLAAYTGNNSLRQTLSQTNATVKLLAPKRANKVYLMGVSGSAISNFNVIIHFTDGTSQTQGMSFPDWYTSNNQVVVSGLGRVNRTNNNLEGSTTGGPRFHDTSIVISMANRNKQIDSITIQRTGTAAGVSNLMAVSIVPNINQSCKLPGELSISNVSCMGGTLSWQGNGTNTNYQISYGPIGSFANAGTIVSVTGNAGANTYNWVNSLSITELQLYVRADCGSGSYSDWVGPLEVTLPNTIITPAFTLPSDICAGATAPLLPATSNNGITGTWSPSVVSNTASGSYTFTPDASFPCAVPVTVGITVSSQITPSFTPIAPFCEGSPAPMLPATSINGFSGTWTPAVVSNTASGIYTFTPSSTGACVGPATMSVTVLPTAQFTETITICSDELPLVWNNITVSAGGSNAATYITPSANGCDSTVILDLNVINNSNPSISINVSPSSTVPTGQTVTFTASLHDAAGSTPTIQWYKSGAPIAGAVGNTWSAIAGVDFYNGDVIYALATDFNQCAATQHAASNEIQMSVTVGIRHANAPDGFLLYPNPSSDFIDIEGLNKGTTYRIVDALGRVMLQSYTDTEGKQRIQLNTLGAGMYLIIFEEISGRKWSHKIQKL